MKLPTTGGWADRISAEAAFGAPGPKRPGAYVGVGSQFLRRQPGLAGIGHAVQQLPDVVLQLLNFSNEQRYRHGVGMRIGGGHSLGGLGVLRAEARLLTVAVGSAVLPESYTQCRLYGVAPRACHGVGQALRWNGRLPMRCSRLCRGLVANAIFTRPSCISCSL